jgi:hypothetical protein
MFVAFGKKRKNMEKILIKGFDENTLTELKDMCVKNFETHPTVYYSLHSIFNEILESFDGQGMPNDLYENYHSLIAPIKAVLVEPDISNLDKLVRSFVQIKPLLK